MPEQSGVELRWILAVLRRWWWLVVGCTLLGGAVALYVTSQMPPKFQATSILLIQPATDSRTSEYNTLVAAERLALTYSEMLTGRTVLESIIDKNQLSEEPDELAKKVTANPIRDTQLIHLTVEDSSATRATMLANAIAQEFTHYIESIQKERYAGAQENKQADIKQLLSQMEALHSEIETLNDKKIDNTANLARLESLETDGKEQYQQLQQEHQNLQLTVSRLTGGISIAEAAQVSVITDTTTTNTVLATVTLMFDQGLLEGEGSYSIETYQNILASRPVLQSAIDQLALEIDPILLTNQISLSVVPNTQLVKVNVADKDSSQAIQLADTIAAVFIEQMNSLQTKPYTEILNKMQAQMDSIQEQTEKIQANITALTSDNLQLETQIGDLEGQLVEQRSDYQALQDDLSQTQLATENAADAVVVAETASIPKEASQRRLLYVGLAGAVSGMIALGAAFLIEYINDSIRTSEDIHQVQNLRTLSSISRLDASENELVTMAQPRSPVAESFRMLAANIHKSSQDLNLRTILVTSPNPGEGKSLVIANLAAALSQRELGVVLVDADLRLPRQHDLFKLERGTGLAGVIQDGRFKLHQVAPTLKVLTSGDSPADPSKVVTSKRITALLDKLASNGDLVLIDCPPILPVADATILASFVDSVVIVVRADQTRRQELQDAVDNINKVSKNLLGVVLNGVSSHADRYNQYYGGKNDTGWNSQRLGRKLGANFKNLFGRDGSKLKEKNKTDDEMLQDVRD